MNTSTGRQWTADDVPDQQGRTAVITGANTGIGFEAAAVLAQRGAAVVLACRDQARAADAAARIRAATPTATVSTLQIDLSSQASVHRAAEELRARHERIDLLINNAGGIRPRRVLTEDGFELTLATNHLGPFAFTGLVLDRLLTVPGSRIVTVSSNGHTRGTIDFDDLHCEHRYRNSTAYHRSKLANLLFTYELHRRLTAAGAQTIAVAAHPGCARTEFARTMSPVARLVLDARLRLFTWWLLQSPHMGALGPLRAAVDPDARGGEYYGPPGRYGFTGHPERVQSSDLSHDVQVQQRLWRESERLTGVTYSLGNTAPQRAAADPNARNQR
jgi:NAD(P)-dependent dehydrogenase (short-subunit alcohol dehydrogenase family)